MTGPSGYIVAIAAVMAIVVVPIVVRLVDRVAGAERRSHQEDRLRSPSSAIADRAAMWVFLGSLLVFGLSWPSLSRPYALTYLVMVEVGLVIGLGRLFWRGRRRRRAPR